MSFMSNWKTLEVLKVQKEKKNFTMSFFFGGGGLLDRVHFRKQKQVVFENRLSGHISRG